MGLPFCAAWSAPTSREAGPPGRGAGGEEEEACLDVLLANAAR